MSKKVAFLHVPLAKEMMRRIDKARAGSPFATRAEFIRAFLDKHLPETSNGRAS